MKNSEFTSDPKAATSSLCAALHLDRACLGIRIVDEPEKRQFYCKHYHVKLESKETTVHRRRVVICKRCEQCRQEHQNLQPDFDEYDLKRLLADN